MWCWLSWANVPIFLLSRYPPHSLCTSFHFLDHISASCQAHSYFTILQAIANEISAMINLTRCRCSFQWKFIFSLIVVFVIIILGYVHLDWSRCCCCCCLNSFVCRSIAVQPLIHVCYKCKICYLSHICRSSWYAHALRNHLHRHIYIFTHHWFYSWPFFLSPSRSNCCCDESKRKLKEFEKSTRIAYTHVQWIWNNAWWHTHGQYALFYMHESNHIYNAAMSYFSSGYFFVFFLSLRVKLHKLCILLFLGRRSNCSIVTKSP